MKYYTSDLHLGQDSILQTGRFKERPFNTQEEMWRVMIDNWNEKVKKSDDVYILGDIGGYTLDQMRIEVIDKLRGRKHLILGNHDMLSPDIKRRFVEIANYKEITDKSSGKSVRLALSHYPILIWNEMFKGRVLLYGHLHNTRDEYLFQKALLEYNKDRCGAFGIEKDAAAYNVGCMLWGYTPMSYEEIKKDYRNVGNKLRGVRRDEIEALMLEQKEYRESKRLRTPPPHPVRI